MKTILLTNSYYYRYDAKQWQTAQPYPPLGTIYAAAVLEEAGYHVNFYDSNLVASEEAFIQLLEESKPDLLLIYDDGFNYLTKMCLTNMREATFSILKKSRTLNIPSVINSSDSTDHFEEYHENGADYVIHGEGEQSLLELCEAIFNDKDAKSIKGISCEQERWMEN